LVRSDSADFLYKCDEFYHPEDQHGTIWNDPIQAIPWGVDAPTVSTKDKSYPTLSNLLLNDLQKYLDGE
jgi:dTDP-4-dehydrorhamnose 3,5-epimerase